MAPRMSPAPAPSAAHVQQQFPTLDEIAAKTQPILDAGRFQPKDEDGLERLARRYYMSGMLPESYYPKQGNRWDERYVEQGTAKAYLAMLKGAVLGIHPSEAIWQIHVINGRPTLSADLMFGRMLATGILRRDDFTLEADKTHCKIVIGVRTRPVSERMVVEAKYEDFKHLHGKENWRNDPEAMLVARCKARACRRHAPDVFVGVYASEEARDLREDRAAGRAEDPVERIMSMVDPPEDPAPVPQHASDAPAGPAVERDASVDVADLQRRIDELGPGDTEAWGTIYGILRDMPASAEKIALVRAHKAKGPVVRGEVQAEQPQAQSGEGGGA